MILHGIHVHICKDRLILNPTWRLQGMDVMLSHSIAWNWIRRQIGAAYSNSLRWWRQGTIQSVLDWLIMSLLRLRLRKLLILQPYYVKIGRHLWSVAASLRPILYNWRLHFIVCWHDWVCFNRTDLMRMIFLMVFLSIIDWVKKLQDTLTCLFGLLKHITSRLNFSLSSFWRGRLFGRRSLLLFHMLPIRRRRALTLLWFLTRRRLFRLLLFTAAAMSLFAAWFFNWFLL